MMNIQWIICNDPLDQPIKDIYVCVMRVCVCVCIGFATFYPCVKWYLFSKS